MITAKPVKLFLFGRLLGGPLIDTSARQSDIERIVKVGSSIAAIDKSLERVEHGQEKLAETMEDGFATLAESIREVRVVGPKG